MDQLTDVTYEVDHGLAWITINRPDRYNSFRARTVDELVECFKRAWTRRSRRHLRSPAPAKGVLRRRRPEAAA